MSEISGIDLTVHVLALVIAFPVLIAFLAFARISLGHGLARVMAAVALFLAAIPLVIIFSRLEQDSLALRYVLLLERMTRTIGWAAFVVPVSVPLALSALGRRHGGRWIDIAHLAALVLLVLLWYFGI
ncbi:MAG: hypothetical protein R3D84_11830 [Paracoccaceae bacterium]